MRSDFGANICIAFAALSLLLVRPALADPCDPKEILKTKIDFSQESNLVKLLYLSQVDQSTLSQTDFSQHGEMIIPYINTPAKNDWNYTKGAAEDVKSLLGINYTQSQTNSIFRMSMDALGVEAYKACLGTKRVLMSAPESALNSEDFIITVIWTPKASDQQTTGKFTQTPIVIGGDVKNPVDSTMTFPPDQSFQFSIHRDLKKAFSFGVNINGNAEMIELPAYVLNNPKFEQYTTPELSIVSNNANGFGAHSDSHCYPPPSGAHFLASTAHLVENVTGADMGSKVTLDQVDSLQACFTVFANTNNAQRGASAKGSVSIWIATPQSAP
jgi:hypothetical protein